MGRRDDRTLSSCLTEHFDGRMWTIVLCPLPPDGFEGFLWAVGVVARDDVWAVGGYTPRQVANELVQSRPLIEHWDGVAWHVVPAPVPPGDSVKECDR